MKKACLLAFLLALATPLFGEEKLPKDLQKCPFGHKDIVLVPIAYGLPNGEKSSIKEKGIGKLPFNFEGGCVISPDSPRNVAGCPECGFTYWPLSNNDWDKGDWTLRVSDQPELFKPLSAALSDFPLIQKNSKKEEATFSQSVDRRGKLLWEGITILRKGKLPDAEALLGPWLASKKIEPDSINRMEGGVEWGNDEIRVGVYQMGRVLHFSVVRSFDD